jgi:hypothetical protein
MRHNNLGRAMLLLALITVLPLSLFAGAPKIKQFDGSMDDVFTAALKAAQSNWSVTFSDRASGLVSFNTGTSFTSNGMECSATLQEMKDGKIQISLKTQKKHGQIVAWGVGDRIADKWFKAIAAQLNKESSSTRNTKD